MKHTTTRWFGNFIVIIGTLFGFAPLQAATTDATDAQAIIEALSRANAAVVGVQVNAAEGARSIQTLGQRRSGSGVVIGADGLILTIGYLMLEAQTIQIVTPENKKLPARAVAYDQATGFGLLRPLLPMPEVQPVPLGSLKDVQIGDALMAATGGQAGGAEADVSMTQLSSKRAFSGFWEYHIDSAAFTSPPINNHSGASLFNHRGELIGIGSLFVTNAKEDKQQLPGNMFVPVDLLKPILGELLKTGSSQQSRRPWLGLSSIEKDGRLQVMRVNPGSPAFEAGVQVGDLVLAVAGTKVTTLETFYKKLWSYAQPETDIQLTVLQGAEVKTLTLKAVDRMSTFLKPAGI